jgi:hypothetical protein
MISVRQKLFAAVKCSRPASETICRLNNRFDGRRQSVGFFGNIARSCRLLGLAAPMPNIISKGLAIGHLDDLNTLKDRLDQQLDKENSVASYVALIEAFGRK